jgi:hypothetical protein
MKKTVVCFGWGSTKTAAEISKAMGNAPYLLTSNMPKRPASERSTISMLEFLPGKEKSKAWSPADVDIEDGGYYVILDRYDVMHGEDQFHSFDSVVQNAKALGIIGATDVIYAPRGKMKKELLANADWVNVLDHIRDEVQRRLTPAVIQEVADHAEFRSVRHLASDASIWNTSMQLADPDGPFARFTRAMRDLEARDAADNKNQTLIALAQSFGTTVQTGKPSVEVKALFELVKHRYPMMMMAMDRYSNRNIHSGNQRIYQDYINMVDAFHNRQLINAVDHAVVEAIAA